MTEQLNWMQQQWTISWLGCDMRWKVDFIQPAMTSSVVELRRSSKAFLKVKLAPKKDHGHCLVVCCCLIHYSFLNSSKTTTSEKYAQQIHASTEKCNACSWHWSTERAQFFFKTTPDYTADNQQFKSWTNWTQSFASFVIFTWLLTNLLPLLQASQQLFVGKTLPQPAGGRKYFPRVHQILMHRFFML